MAEELKTIAKALAKAYQIDPRVALHWVEWIMEGFLQSLRVRGELSIRGVGLWAVDIRQRKDKTWMDETGYSRSIKRVPEVKLIFTPTVEMMEAMLRGFVISDSKPCKAKVQKTQIQKKRVISPPRF